MFNLGQIKNSTLRFIQRNFSILLFLVVIFISGVTFGSITVKMLNHTEKSELIHYLSSFFQGFQGEFVLQKDLLAQQAIFYNLKSIFILWILGVSMIGLPLIPIIIFLRGFVIGFAVGFLVEELAIKGLIFAISAMLPHNIIVIPVLIIAGVAAVAFALNLLKSKFSKRPLNFVQYFFGYSTMMGLLGIILVVAALIESLLTPLVMELVINFIVAA
ncbi:stage II sporulation protein M [Fuchsiella alkaliacetigena]|uniref:stage II sporulation protein M n=1 Tax=Fuchsiella alkaliacetigena TaxID=957042 RepID=UPI00200B981B|nr:stage II sporulation protein M [Fuchsiella alkaliacetigena]MCK8824756.1 stage II sporulation protein M [Fuchsiella alkaliacetigena]